jgi:hypothetical protein
MASDAEWSLGDHVEMGDGEVIEGFDRIPEIGNITFSLGQRTRVDVSSHDSTPPFRDNIATFLEDGTITLQGNYLPENAIQQALENARSDDDPTTFRVVFEQNEGDVVWQGKARVLSVQPTSAFEDARRFTANLATTGFWERVAGS